MEHSPKDVVTVNINRTSADDPDRFVAGLVTEIKAAKPTTKEALDKAAREFLDGILPEIQKPLRREIESLRSWLTNETRTVQLLQIREQALQRELSEYTVSLAKFAVESMKHRDERERMQNEIAELKAKLHEATAVRS